MIQLHLLADYFTIFVYQAYKWKVQLLARKALITSFFSTHKTSIIYTSSDDFYLCLSLSINHSYMSVLYCLRFHGVQKFG